MSALRTLRQSRHHVSAPLAQAAPPAACSANPAERRHPAPHQPRKDQPVREQSPPDGPYGQELSRGKAVLEPCRHADAGVPRGQGRGRDDAASLGGHRDTRHGSKRHSKLPARHPMHDDGGVLPMGLCELVQIVSRAVDARAPDAADAVGEIGLYGPPFGRRLRPSGVTQADVVRGTMGPEEG